MLLKSVVGSRGICYMSLSRMMGITNKYLDCLRACFFWGLEEGITNFIGLNGSVFWRIRREVG